LNKKKKTLEELNLSVKDSQTTLASAEDKKKELKEQLASQ